MENAVYYAFVHILLFRLLSGFCSGDRVFYVQPTGSNPTTVCPPDDSPCHSLQYYANHSTFTNNSMFLFLEGEHHLDSVVGIRNVANLSLVGAKAGVKIFCDFFPAGFRVNMFTNVNFENLTLFNCSGSKEPAFRLVNGSEAHFGHVSVVSNGSVFNYELFALDITGSFSLSDLTLTGRIQVNYSLCNKPSLFNFSNNRLGTGDEYGCGLEFELSCSDVQIIISHSILIGHLYGTFNKLTNNSITVHRSTLINGNIDFHSSTLYNDSCNTVLFNEVRVYNISHIYLISQLAFSLIFSAQDSMFKDCIIFFDSSSSGFDSVSKSSGDSEVLFQNVTLSNYAMTINGQISALKVEEAIVSLVSCIIEGNTGSAIEAHLSKVIFQGSNIIRGNSAIVGGGIKLLDWSYMHLRPHTHVLFENNHAGYVGGAIYNDYTELDDACFFHLDSPIGSDDTIGIDFSNNTADYAGASIYGRVTSCCSTFLCNEFTDIFHVSNTESDPSAIASDPFEVCLCDGDSNQPNCSVGLPPKPWKKTHQTQAFPGEDFTLRLAVVSEFNGVVSAAIRAYLQFPYGNTTLGYHQISQASGKPVCRNFNYSVYTSAREVSFNLITDQSFLRTVSTVDSESSIMFVTVHLKNCPLGFSLSQAEKKCVCDPIISENDVKCFINDQSILRPANAWIGIISMSSTLLFHPNCPIGYCIPNAMNITANSSDTQCAPHRTGLLCGKCQEGYSLTLGSPTCAKCTNTYLFLLLPLALAGLLLVASLFALNLTVTEGSINGLIFYANVIGMNYSVFFSMKSSYLYAFLAWLNLDLGIDTCLFDGMDGYAEIWLQLVFPVYLWALLLAVILLYRKTPKLASRLGGENAVKVLATLFLLSYTKLQRTVVTILSFTWLKYPDGVVRYVWLYDANVEFFKGKHLYLGLAGIFILVFLIVPYTFSLAFFQQLQACSSHRLFQWVNKFKPVFDAYAGPYKDKYRFWTGMLLVVRTLLIVLFTINTSASADVNLLIVSVVSCALLVAIANGVYKKWSYNHLESFFYVQLVVFAAGVAYGYTKHNHGNITSVADTSIGLTLMVTVAVLGHHLLRRIKVSWNHHRGYAEIREDVSLTHERIVT